MKKMTIKLVAIVAVALFSGPAFAESQGDPYIGKRLYRSYCFICHGKDGATPGPLALKRGLEPANLSGGKYQSKNVEELTAIIEGYKRKKSGMPKWGDHLPKANIRSIAAYILKIEETDLRITGNPRRGRLIFLNSCVACHGKSGKGNGILAKLMGIKMKDYTKPDSVSSFSDGVLMNIIRYGSNEYMIAWEGTLGEDEIRDVAAYVRSLGSK